MGAERWTEGNPSNPSPKAKSSSKLPRKGILVFSHSLSLHPILMFNLIRNSLPPTRPRDHHLSPVRGLHQPEFLPLLIASPEVPPFPILQSLASFFLPTSILKPQRPSLPLQAMAGRGGGLPFHPTRPNTYSSSSLTSSRKPTMTLRLTQIPLHVSPTPFILP